MSNAKVLCGNMYILKQNDTEGKEQYEVKIWNQFATMENVDDIVDFNRAWKSIRVNIKTAIKESLGY